jgi:hypothetical protein
MQQLLHHFHWNNALVFVQESKEEVVTKSVSEFYFEQLLEKLEIQDSIQLTKNGKPFFSDTKLHFNIAHTDHFWMAGFAKFAIGIDAESKKAEHLLHNIDPLLGINTLVDWCVAESIIKCADRTLDDIIHLKCIEEYHQYSLWQEDYFVHSIGFHPEITAFLSTAFPNVQVEVQKLV